MIAPPPDHTIRAVVQAALEEDLGLAGDLTSLACIDPDARFSVTFGLRQEGVIAGMACARAAFLALDPAMRFDIETPDGTYAPVGTVIARAEGNARAVLGAERTALNLAGRLSGIASLTHQYVQAVAGAGAKIADTRKTTPGLRALEKYAVRCGGGMNHRFALFDAILIKDNHIAACGGAAEAVRRARAFAGHLVKVEVEVDTLAQLDEVLPERPDVIMLDNFALPDMAAAVRRANGQVILEASGGVNLTTVRAIAETGVDLISVGALTHSAPVLDIGLDAA